MAEILGKWDLCALKRMLPATSGFDDIYRFVIKGIDYFTHEEYLRVVDDTRRGLWMYNQAVSDV